MEEHRTSIGSLALRKAVGEEQQSSAIKRHLTLVDGKVRVTEAISDYELQLFGNVKNEILKDNPIWPGQSIEDSIMYFNPDTNPYSSYLKMKPFIAIRDGQVVGRVCAILNERYNDYWQQNIGFFGFFDCIDDIEVAKELMKTVETIAKDNGKEGIYGPISPTIQDEVGILVDSFDKLPPSGLAYNPPYYPVLLEELGYGKVKDILHPISDVQTIAEKVEKKMAKIQPFLEDPNIYARCFDWNEFDRDAEIIRELFYTQTFADHWGYYPVDAQEWRNMLEAYKPHIYEDLFLVIEDAGEAIGFALCFKDDNEIKLANKLGQKVINNRQKWDLVGIKPDYHRNGLGTFIVYNLLASLQNHGIETLCGSWVLEDNLNSLGLCRSVGLDFHTIYRIYQKSL